MKSPDQWHPVTRAFPSPPACLARTLPQGGIAHMLLCHVGGCQAKMVDEM